MRPKPLRALSCALVVGQFPRHPFDIRKRRPYPRRADQLEVNKEEEVTVCIAIACDCLKSEISPKLIMIADQMVSSGASSSLSKKIGQIADSWFAMIAGNDVSEAANVMAWASKDIKQITDKTTYNVSQAVKEAYRRRRTTLLEEHYLAPYNWDMGLFLKDGRKALGGSLFERTKFVMDEFDLGFTLLVCGFESTNSRVPVFFEINNPGTVTARTFPGNYVGIGSGHPNAMAYLDWRKQHRSATQAESVYNAISAKAMSESALGVGKETSVMVVECADGFPVNHLYPQRILAIRKIWENEEANVRPKNLEERVTEVLNLEMPSSTS